MSCVIVGDAYASITATVTPRPSLPLAIALAIPYAPWSCAPAYPHGANSYGGIGSTLPSGVGVVATGFSPQYDAHGRALTNAAGGGAFADAGRTSASLSSRPTMPAIAGSDEGTVNVLSGERSCAPA